MKILIVDFVVRKNSGGVLSVLKDFYEYAVNDTENEYVFLVGTKGICFSTSNIKVIVDESLQNSYFKRLVFDSFSGKKFVKRVGVNVVISLQNTAVLGTSIQQIVYLHQPLPFVDNYKFSILDKRERKLWFYQNVVGRIIKANLSLFKQGTVVVQSKWMEKAARKYTSANIIINRPKIQLGKQISKQNFRESRSFFYPSTAMSYKNHKRLVEAYSGLDESIKKEMPLILTLTAEELRYLGVKNVDEHVVCKGRISHQQVMELLKSSTLVFPSEIETLGLPIIEAMSLGTPIVAATIPSVLEIARGYEDAEWFNPKSMTEIRQALLNSFDKKHVFKPFVEDSDSSGIEQIFDTLR